MMKLVGRRLGFSFILPAGNLLSEMYKYYINTGIGRLREDATLTMVLVISRYMQEQR